MTYADKQPRPDDTSHEPHWENNSLGSSSSDPYTNSQSSPYQNNNGGWPSASPSPIYSQNQTEPYWGKNRPPYTPQPNPFSKNKLPDGFPALSLEELNARHPRTPGKPRPRLGDSIGLSEEYIEKNVDKPSSGYQETAHKIAKGDSNNDNAAGTISPTSETNKTPKVSEDIPGLSNEVGKPLDKNIQKEFTQKFGTSERYLEGIEVVHNKKTEEANKVLGSKAVSAGKKIYMGKKGANDPKVLPYEVAHFHPKSIEKGSGLVKCWVKDDPAVKEAERKRREAEAERKRQAAIKAAADKAAADKAAANKRKADKAVADKAAANKLKQDGLTHQTDKKEQVKPKLPIRRPHELINAEELKAKMMGNDANKKPEQAKQDQQAKQHKEQLQKAVQNYPGIQNVLNHSAFIKGAATLGAGALNPAWGASLLAGAGLLGAHKTKPEQKQAAQPEKQEDSGFFGKALNFGKNLVKGAAKASEQILKTGEGALGTVTQAIPQSVKDLANPVKLASAVMKGAGVIATAPAKAAGGWFDGAKNFGQGLFNGAKNLGSNLVNGATTLGNSALNLGDKLVKGAGNLANKASEVGGKLFEEVKAHAAKDPLSFGLDVFQGALDVAGFIPVLGAVPDLLNAGIHLARGNYAEAAMSAVAAIPGVGDVIGGGAKIATRVGKALPTAVKVADKLSDAAHLVNSPAGKVITNTLPTLVAGGTASVQALSGDTKGATSTLLNMGLPMLGNHGGKALSNVAEGVNNPMLKTAVNVGSKTLTGVGMSAPVVMSGQQTVQTFQDWQAGKATAGQLLQSMGNTVGSGYGAKAQMRANRNGAALGSHEAPEFGVATRQDPKMKPGQIDYTYKNGVPVVRHGGGVSEADLKLHRDMAWQSGNDAVNQVKGDIVKPVTSFFNFGNKPQGNKPRVGTLGYEFGREDVKHQMRADTALAQAQELRQKGDVTGAQRLEQQAQGYRQQAEDYAHVANNPALRHQKGDGYVANDRPTRGEKPAQRDQRLALKKTKEDAKARGDDAAADQARYELNQLKLEVKGKPGTTFEQWSPKNANISSSRSVGRERANAITDDLGLVNNDYKSQEHKPVIYSNGKTGEDYKGSRPDALSDTRVIEIKSFKDGTEEAIARNRTDQTDIQRKGAKDDGKQHTVIMDTSGSRDSARPSGKLNGKSDVYHLNRDTGEWSRWDPLANGRKGAWEKEILTTREVSKELGGKLPPE